MIKRKELALNKLKLVLLAALMLGMSGYFIEKEASSAGGLAIVVSITLIAMSIYPRTKSDASKIKKLLVVLALILTIALISIGTMA